ncbi:hypothetical protein Gogos_015247 [Gossypium gossypioides]|uniref:DUF4283 domain-containing protein n=1 Tax=Gossypium gossypioides TaxID=34282 RepID=A0A7J9C139_GOSGO|nr:hypothetical protein [Gossypium gossypioides]
MTWIQLSGLIGYLYNKKILEEIGGMIERVVKLDFNNDKIVRRQFAQLAIFVNLDKPLILQILVNDKPQRGSVAVEPMIGGLVKEATKFGPWMIVERWSHRNLKYSHKSTAKISSGDENGFRFKALALTTRVKVIGSVIEEGGLDKKGHRCGSRLGAVRKCGFWA